MKYCTVEILVLWCLEAEEQAEESEEWADMIAVAASVVAEVRAFEVFVAEFVSCCYPSKAKLSKISIMNYILYVFMCV